MKVSIADTIGARYYMAKAAIRELKAGASVQIARYTVPGINDLPVAAKKLIEEEDCENGNGPGDARGCRDGQDSRPRGMMGGAELRHHRSLFIPTLVQPSADTLDHALCDPDQ
jgi:hypothetical protein